MRTKYQQMAADLRALCAQEHNDGEPWDMIQEAADMIDELKKQLHDLTVSANTALYCYQKMPGNFAGAMKALQEQADSIRSPT